MLRLAFGPALLLDEDLCFRRSTPKVAEDFNLIPADFGRRIDGFAHTILWDNLQSKMAHPLSHAKRFERENRNKSGDKSLIRILTHRRTTERSGVVMTVIDNTCLKQAKVLFRNAICEVKGLGISFDMQACGFAHACAVVSHSRRRHGIRPPPAISVFEVKSRAD